MVDDTLKNQAVTYRCAGKTMAGDHCGAPSAFPFCPQHAWQAEPGAQRYVVERFSKALKKWVYSSEFKASSATEARKIFAGHDKRTGHEYRLQFPVVDDKPGKP